MTSTREITLRDGRRAAVHVTEGTAGGRTVVFCHSAPGAGVFDPAPMRLRPGVSR